jgi:outer membrane protein insertion porin family
VRVSLGVGLVFPLPVGNIEVNYVKTVRRDRLDRTKEGLQVGLATALAF